MKKQKIIKCAVWAAVLTLVFSSTAFAYIDPGAGSNYLQKLLAGIFSVAYSVKTLFRKLFSGGKNSDGDN